MPDIITNVIGRKATIDASSNGKFHLLSDTGGQSAGMWVVQFVPDPDDPADCSLSVQGRVQGQQAFDDEVGFAPIPYRAAVLNTETSDYALRDDAITGHSLLAVPATGLAIALLVSCASGKGHIYSYPRTGDAAL